MSSSSGNSLIPCRTEQNSTVPLTSLSSTRCRGEQISWLFTIRTTLLNVLVGNKLHGLIKRFFSQYRVDWFFGQVSFSLRVCPSLSGRCRCSLRANVKLSCKLLVTLLSTLMPVAQCSQFGGASHIIFFGL